MSFARAVLICVCFLGSFGFSYVFLLREKLLEYVRPRVSLDSAVRLPDTIGSFNDQVALALALMFLWPGEVLYIYRLYKRGKKQV